ncbi:hypothetical protein C8J57DRAFT_1478261 [Mycena rebaudengoi]|nr:hypothetical protein C8J57DRAFT_1478261 [Mycena rebaudengoi]
MMDLSYAVLLLCLLATNLSRLWHGFLWVYHLIPARHNTRLVPYFNHEGQMIGMVRIPVEDPHSSTQARLTVDKNMVQNPEHLVTDTLSAAKNRRARTLEPAALLRNSGTAEISALSTWDGWPDGRFQCFLSPQEVADTHELEINWVCESLKARRGKCDALTWQRGKESRRQCVGVLECTSRACAFGMKIAPAIRGVDRHRQLQEPCLCGELLRLRGCEIESSVFLFRSGAFFSNSGKHTHSRFTHSLLHRPQDPEPFAFAEYVSKSPVGLQDTQNSESEHSSSSDSDNEEEWFGINITDDPAHVAGFENSYEHSEDDESALKEVEDDPEANDSDD